MVQIGNEIIYVVTQVTDGRLRTHSVSMAKRAAAHAHDADILARATKRLSGYSACHIPVAMPSAVLIIGCLVLNVDGMHWRQVP